MTITPRLGRGLTAVYVLGALAHVALSALVRDGVGPILGALVCLTAAILTHRATALDVDADDGDDTATVETATAARVALIGALTGACVTLTAAL